MAPMTALFPPHIKPVREGYYLVESETPGYAHTLYWDINLMKWKGHQASSTSCHFQGWAWRGLSSQQLT